MHCLWKLLFLWTVSFRLEYIIPQWTDPQTTVQITQKSINHTKPQKLEDAIKFDKLHNKEVKTETNQSSKKKKTNKKQ